MQKGSRNPGHFLHFVKMTNVISYKMKKINITEKYPGYYTAPDYPEVINVEKANFVSLQAKGSFSEKIFYARIALLKQVVRLVIDIFKDSGQGFEQSVLEGLYWNDEKYGKHTISRIFDTGPLNELNYRLMIRVPDYVTAQHIATAKEALAPYQWELSKGIGLFEYQEGKCVQMLHKGPFIYEYKTLEQLEEFAADNNLAKGGIHHEIYLVDFTTVDSQGHLETILREPVQ
jgi:hypothetical protein